MTAPAEPTDEQLRAANTLIVRQQGLPEGFDLSMAPLVQVVAHAFADREAAMHARYEAVAQEWVDRVSDVNPFLTPMADQVYADTLTDCASDLRAVKGQ